MVDLGQLIFATKKPAPTFAFKVVVVLLVFGSIAISYWTIPIIRNARPGERLADVTLSIVMHVIPLIAAGVVFDNIRRARLGTLQFFEHGLICTADSGTDTYSYKEVQATLVKDEPDQSGSIVKGALALATGSWGLLGKAWHGGTQHFWIRLTLPGGNTEAIQIPSAELFAQLESAITNDAT